MPEAELARRGGVVRTRTLSGDTPAGKAKGLRPGEYVKVYVVRRPGPQGGRTVIGEVHRS